MATWCKSSSRRRGPGCSSSKSASVLRGAQVGRRGIAGAGVGLDDSLTAGRGGSVGLMVGTRVVVGL